MYLKHMLNIINKRKLMYLFWIQHEKFNLQKIPITNKHHSKKNGTKITFLKLNFKNNETKIVIWLIMEYYIMYNDKYDYI